jgi:hypothetical protein
VHESTSNKIDAGRGLRLTLAAFATWRVTHLLALEDGPGDIVVALRSRLGDGQLGRLMDCFDCLSLWTAAPVAVLVGEERRDWPLLWLGLSGAACLMQSASGEAVVMQPLAAQEP